MINPLSLNNVTDALIPITRFNRGEANKIFDEVRETGCKVVVKNNTPTCILLTPEKYNEIMEAMEDERLLAIAMERERNDNGNRTTFEDELRVSGLTLADIEAMEEPVYGVDFE
jgi:PHD/YefM family antitoxin component YafN of YafNO toxin-antitoxin module